MRSRQLRRTFPMKWLSRRCVPPLLGLAVVLLAAACQCAWPAGQGVGGTATTASGSATTAVSRSGDGGAAVTGAIAYRESIALPPGTTLEVELRDVSRVDGPSQLIARLIMAVQGRGPVAFHLEYDRADIRPDSTYAVQASIMYADGSLAFVTDTAYEVITQGRPDEVDIVLVMVSPPPAGVAAGITPVAGEWVVVPAAIRKVEVEEYEAGYLLTVTYRLPGGEDCSRHTGLTAELVGTNFRILVNNLEKRADDGSPACASPPREEAVEIPMEGPFTPGAAYLVRVNERLTNSFTPPPAEYVDPVVVPSPIEEAELLILERFPPVYNVRVVSALPLGSSCSAFNGYAVERRETGRIGVLVTHHETRAADVVCTEDDPLVETTVPLGGDLEPGREYAVDLNGQTLTFRAQ